MRISVSVALVLLACVAGSAQAPPQQIFFSRVFPVPQDIGLFIANADGSDEHPLPGTSDVDYDAGVVAGWRLDRVHVRA